MTETGLKQYRARAEQLAQRAETDEAFARQAKADPVGTLTAAGIPADAARQMLQLIEGEAADVTGYRQCHDLTCWSSECPWTCHITICQC